MTKFPVLEARTASAGALDTDVVLVFQDAGKKPIPPRDGGYATLIERFRKGEAFAARPGSTQYVRFGGKATAENVLFVGLGASAELTEERARQAGGPRLEQAYWLKRARLSRFAWIACMKPED